jgi:hypothetical protein
MMKLMKLLKLKLHQSQKLQKLLKNKKQNKKNQRKRNKKSRKKPPMELLPRLHQEKKLLKTETVNVQEVEKSTEDGAEAEVNTDQEGSTEDAVVTVKYVSTEAEVTIEAEVVTVNIEDVVVTVNTEVEVVIEVSIEEESAEATAISQEVKTMKALPPLKLTTPHQSTEQEVEEEESTDLEENIEEEEMENIEEEEMANTNQEVNTEEEVTVSTNQEASTEATEAEAKAKEVIDMLEKAKNTPRVFKSPKLVKNLLQKVIKRNELYEY